jgi:hypothetical protein
MHQKIQTASFFVRSFSSHSRARCFGLCFLISRFEKQMIADRFDLLAQSIETPHHQGRHSEA